MKTLSRQYQESSHVSLPCNCVLIKELLRCIVQPGVTGHWPAVAQVCAICQAL